MFSAASHANSAPKFTVTLQRQVVALSTKAKPATWSYAIGTGSLRPVPPGYDSPGEESDVLTADYEGEIELGSHVAVGGFDIGKIRVSVSGTFSGSHFITSASTSS